MSDFLDDYLDGLSSGQRFNPLPYGPYNGTKDKRQWHLLADSEHEQAIYESRMREEEESAGAEGAAAEGGSSPVPEAVRAGLAASVEVPVVEYLTTGGLDITTNAIEYPTVTETETFGNTTTSDGNVTSVEELFTNSTGTDINTVVHVQATTYDNLVTDYENAQAIFTLSQTNMVYNDVITDLQQANDGTMYIVNAGDIHGNSYPGFFDATTGIASPAIALGGEYCIIFRALIDFNYYTGLGVFTHMFSTQSTTNPTVVTMFTDLDDNGNGTEFYLDLNVNLDDTIEQVVNAIETSYQQQTTKYWSYGLVKLSAVTAVSSE